MQTISYKLEYCECCGTLRLRRAGSPQTYCQPCEQALFHAPLPGRALQARLLRRKPRASRKDPPPLVHSAAQLELGLSCGQSPAQAAPLHRRLP